MPLPTLSQVHINKPLTNISIMYRQQAAGYIASRIFPTVPVVKQSDSYFEYDRADFLRDMAQVRGPSQESAGSGYNLSNTSYTAKVFAFHKDVDDQVRENTDSPLSADRDATEFVTQVMLTRMEKEWTDTYFTTSVWDTDVTPSPTWDDVTSTPIKDVKTGTRTIKQNTGFKPNKLVIGWQVNEQLTEHPNIVDRIKYTSADSITPALLARYFEIDEVLVAEAVIQTGAAGTPASYSFIHGKNALLAYAAPRPAIQQPSAGYMFEWTGISYGLGVRQAVGRIPMPWLGRGNVRIEGQIAFDPKVVSTPLGYFFDGAVA